MLGLATAGILAAGRNLFQQAVLNERFNQRLLALEKGFQELPDRVTARVVEALRERER